MVHPGTARLGIKLHAGHRADPHGPGLPLRRLQISARTHLDRRRLPVTGDSRHGVHRPGTALRSGRLLGTWDRCFHRQPRTDHRSCDREIDVRGTHHRGRDLVALLHAPCVRDSGDVDRSGRAPPFDGTEAWHQRMANARAPRETRYLRVRISRADKEGWSALLSLRYLERYV